MIGKRGSQVQRLKIKRQEVWCHNERSPFTATLPLTSVFVLLWNSPYKGTSVGTCVMKICIFAHLNVYNLSHNMQLFTTFAYPLAWSNAGNCGCTNQQLSQLLAVCLTWTKSGPVQQHPNQSVTLRKQCSFTGSEVCLVLAVKLLTVWIGCEETRFSFQRLYKKYNSCLTYKTNRSTVIAVLHWTNLFSTLICILWVQHLSHHHAVLFYCWHKEIQKHSLVTSLISPV